jgi:hypothetical protein
MFGAQEEKAGSFISEGRAASPEVIILHDSGAQLRPLRISKGFHCIWILLSEVILASTIRSARHT